MSTEAVLEAPADASFVDSFQAFMQTQSAEPTGGLPGLVEPAPVIETPAPEPEPKAVTPAKPVDPTNPIKAIDDVVEDDDSMKLPIDEDQSGAVADDPEADKDNPYDKGTPQHRRFAEMRKEASILKTSLETERQAKTQLESKLQEIEAAAARAQELEEKVKAYEAKITVTNLLESEAYKETIQKPLMGIIERSDEIADRYGIDRDALADALEIEDEKARRDTFKKLTSGLDIDPEDHVEIRTLAKELQPLKAKKADLIENADKALAELEASREREQQEQVLRASEERKNTVDKVAKHIETRLPFIKTLEGVDFDKMVAQVKETNFDAIDVPNKAYSQIAAQLLPKFIKTHNEQQLQIEKLSDELAKYRKQTPRLTPDMGVPDNADDNDGLIDRYKKMQGLA